MDLRSKLAQGKEDTSRDQQKMVLYVFTYGCHTVCTHNKSYVLQKCALNCSPARKEIAYMQLNISKGGGGGAEQWERDFYDNRYYNLACNGYYTIPPTVVHNI